MVDGVARMLLYRHTWLPLGCAPFMYRGSHWGLGDGPAMRRLCTFVGWSYERVSIQFPRVFVNSEYEIHMVYASGRYRKPPHGDPSRGHKLWRASSADTAREHRQLLARLTPYA